MILVQRTQCSMAFFAEGSADITSTCSGELNRLSHCSHFGMSLTACSFGSLPAAMAGRICGQVEPVSKLCNDYRI